MKLIKNLNHCQIMLGEAKTSLKTFIAQRPICYLTDKNVFNLYPQFFNDGTVIILEPGEQNKNLQTVEKVINELVDKHIDRSNLIVGVGGGIVCDITGFIASIYMRGTSFGLIPTTLLAQIDAAIGGKNGVNFNNYKNIIGIIKQPEFVIIDQTFLQTLTQTDISCGFSEIIKTALIADSELFHKLETHHKELQTLESNITSYILQRCIQIKSTYVEADEKEFGIRRILNFGHTVGHAIEKINHLPHGEAVSVGMSIAAHISCSHNFLIKEDVKKIDSILSLYKLPNRINLNLQQLMLAICKDKKKNQSQIHFVMLEKIGKARIENISLIELETLLDQTLKDIIT